MTARFGPTARMEGALVVLAGFFRSGTSHRLRIALNLKSIAYDYEAVSLPKREHKSEAFLAVNPQGLVPVLKVRGKPLLQSPAILEWLEETFPAPPLLPPAADDRARVRAIAATVGCDIHPINNLRVLNHLKSAFGADEAAVGAWCRYWIGSGFAALEVVLARDTTRDGFCFGGTPTLADCYLIPQIFSARRFKLDLAPFPQIRQIEETCGALQPFIDAAPDRQPDAV
jgi:maleylpyruvate isomerase